MTTAQLEQLLKQFDLAKVGEITLAGNRLGFVLSSNPNDTGYVYAWIEQSGDTAAVVYIGKAGKTLRARCDQHAGGFRSSKTGQKHADCIRRGLAMSKKYFVYARKSAVSDVLGETHIPMESVEELALIKKLTPEWNALS